MKKIKYFSCFYQTIFFAAPKNIRLNSTHYLVMKIPNKTSLQQISFSNSSEFVFQDFMNLYIKCCAKAYSFLVIDTTLHQIIFQKES